MCGGRIVCGGKVSVWWWNSVCGGKVSVWWWNSECVVVE